MGPVRMTNVVPRQHGRPRHRRPHPGLVEGQGAQVAGAREDGQAVLCRTGLLGGRRARLLRGWQDAQRPAEVSQGQHTRGLAVRGLQHRLKVERALPRLGRLYGV